MLSPAPSFNQQPPLEWKAALGKTFRQFFLGAPPAAFNLGVFRVIFFYHLFLYGRIDLVRLVQFSRTMVVPPPGYEGWYHLIPVSPGLALAMQAVFLVSCALACIGFMTRTSCAVAFFSGLYVLGLPCFFGKINHYQHLVWFPSILAAAHSGEALSLDTLLRTLSRARRNAALPAPAVDPPDAVIALRCIGVLLASVYFFPGLWKLWDCGWEWVFSDNLKYLMRRMWYLYDYVPPVRPDLYPFVYQGAALAAVLFEISAVFLALFPPLYPVLVAGGLAFHYLSETFLSIDFESLVICYAVFVNWAWAPAVLRKKFTMEEVPRPAPQGSWNRNVNAVLVVFAVWMAGTLWCGPQKLATWPVGVYPLFNYVSQPDHAVVIVGFENAQGQVAFRSFKEVYRNFNTPTRWQLELKILGVSTNRSPFREVAIGLARTALRNFPQLRQSTAAVHFYRDRVLLDPGLKYEFLPGRQRIIRIPVAMLRGPGPEQQAGT